MTMIRTLTAKKHPGDPGWRGCALLALLGVAALVGLGRCCAVEPGAVVLAEEKTAASAAVKEGV